jgi:hypothetical protein
MEKRAAASHLDDLARLHVEIYVQGKQETDQHHEAERCMLHQETAYQKQEMRQNTYKRIDTYLPRARFEQGI